MTVMQLLSFLFGQSSLNVVNVLSFLHPYFLDFFMACKNCLHKQNLPSLKFMKVKYINERLCLFTNRNLFFLVWNQRTFTGEQWLVYQSRFDPDIYPILQPLCVITCFQDDPHISLNSFKQENGSILLILLIVAGRQGDSGNVYW